MKFTIGIPAYKAAYLKECIDSILSQSCQDFELIIVNDASPENIKGVVCNYQGIKYYENDVNFGAVNVVDNWNMCLSYAKGEYFILMGDDDKLDENYLEEFNSLIKKHPDCGVYHCRTIIMNEVGEFVTVTEPRPEFESVYDSVFQRMQENRLFFISDYVFHTATLRKNGGFYKLPLAWASDDISSFIAAEQNGIAHINKPLFMYRRNPQTISTTGNTFLKMDAILGEESWLRNFVTKIPKNDIDKILRENIDKTITKFIQKKKIRTIYAESGSNIVSSFYKWLRVRKKYNLSIDELLYASMMKLKERRKKVYG